MPAIQTKRFSFFRTLTAYESAEAYREKRKAVREDFEERQSAATNAFAITWSEHISGAGELAAQAALKRIEAAIKAKSEAQSADSGDNIIPSTKNSVFSVTSSTTLDGGSKIDLDGGTLTLPDGTVIDLTTGLKKLDVVV